MEAHSHFFPSAAQSHFPVFVQSQHSPESPFLHEPPLQQPQSLVSLSLFLVHFSQSQFLQSQDDPQVHWVAQLHLEGSVVEAIVGDDIDNVDD